MTNTLLNEHSNFSVVLNDDQPRRLASMLAEELRGEEDERRKRECETLISNKLSCEMLGKGRGTLWRWHAGCTPRTALK